MSDPMLPAVRSRVMASIRGRNTRPELYVRRAVWRQGFRYRLHVRKLPGTPDLVLPKYRVVIFVHGCFWHRHGCSNTRLPSSNLQYWEPKLERNVARDAQNQAQLREMGWTVVVIWECRLQDDTDETLRYLRAARVALATSPTVTKAINRHPTAPSNDA